MVDKKLLMNGLKNSSLKIKVKIFESIDSTNTEAKRQIVDGIRQDLLIVSSKQTAGRGRNTRTWFSPEGGLYFSLVVRPRLGPQFAPLASLLCGVAVAKGLQSLGVEHVQLKWPNDVLVVENKIAGILNELVTIDPVDSWMILGIGINQNITHTDFPEEIAGTSTSVQEILGIETSPEVRLENKNSLNFGQDLEVTEEIHIGSFEKTTGGNLSVTFFPFMNKVENVDSILPTTTLRSIPVVSIEDYLVGN